jgi:hypothetical protein
MQISDMAIGVFWKMSGTAGIVDDAVRHNAALVG